jgi:hypothetical protein
MQGSAQEAIKNLFYHPDQWADDEGSIWKKKILSVIKNGQTLDEESILLLKLYAGAYNMVEGLHYTNKYVDIKFPSGECHDKWIGDRYYYRTEPYDAMKRLARAIWKAYCLTHPIEEDPKVPEPYNPYIEEDETLPEAVDETLPEAADNNGYALAIPDAVSKTADELSWGYIKYAWKEIADRRQRGLPNDWTFIFNDFPALVQAGFLSFTAEEDETNKLFTVWITVDVGGVFAITLDSYRPEAYCGGAGVLAAACLSIIAGMVCYAETSPGSGSGRIPARPAVRRPNSKRAKRRYYGLHKSTAGGLGKKKTDTSRQAVHRTWTWRHLGHSLDQRHIISAQIRAEQVARWIEPVPFGCTFVRDCWIGDGDRKEVQVAPTDLYNSFRRAITEMLEQNMTWE